MDSGPNQLLLRYNPDPTPKRWHLDRLHVGGRH